MQTVCAWLGTCPGTLSAGLAWPLRCSCPCTALPTGQPSAAQPPRLCTLPAGAPPGCDAAAACAAAVLSQCCWPVLKRHAAMLVLRSCMPAMHHLHGRCSTLGMHAVPGRADTCACCNCGSSCQQCPHSCGKPCCRCAALVKHEQGRTGSPAYQRSCRRCPTRRSSSTSHLLSAADRRTAP